MRTECDDLDETIDKQTHSRSDNRPRDVPRCTANLWSDKSFVETLRVGIGLRYIGRRYTDTASRASLPGCAMVDVSLSWWVRPDLTLGFELYNLFNHQYALANDNGGRQWTVGQPRSSNITADFNF